MAIEGRGLVPENRHELTMTLKGDLLYAPVSPDTASQRLPLKTAVIHDETAHQSHSRHAVGDVKSTTLRKTELGTARHE